MTLHFLLFILSILTGSGFATLWFYDLDIPYAIKRYIIQTPTPWRPIKPFDCLRCTHFWFQALTYTTALFVTDLSLSFFLLTLPAIFYTSKLLSSHP